MGFEKDESSFVDSRFGYFSLRPPLLQKLNNSKCLLLSLCCCTAVQSLIANALFAISVPSLERRFHLSSVQSGILSSVYDVGVLLAIFPISFLGNRGHKGTWYGAGICLIALGSLLFASPQFLSGNYEYSTESSKRISARGGVALCNSSLAQGNGESCSGDGHSQRSPLHFFAILILAQILNGLGTSPISTLGVAYLDENVSQRSSPLYIGIYKSAIVVGVATGYFLMSSTLNIYGDFLTANMTIINQDFMGTANNDLWYGAYWLNYIIASALALCAALPVLGFARVLPGTQKHRLKDIDQRNRISEDASTATAHYGKKLSEIPAVIKNLACNPTLVGLLIMKSATAFTRNGATTFAPKILESAYGMNRREASFLIGIVFVCGGLTGGLLSGYLLRRFKLKVRGALIFMIVLHAISFCGDFAYFIRCSEVNIAGINAPYRGDIRTMILPAKGGFELNHTCNLACNCGEIFKPVCEPNSGTVYASACHAGCDAKASKPKTRPKLYTNCACLPQKSDIVHQGFCKKACPQKYIFILIIIVVAMVTAMLPAATFMVMLRCVPFNQRTLALGLSFTIMRLVGFIPGPIVYGSILDNACLVWNESCGERLSCRKYNPKLLANKLVFVGVCSTCVSIFGLIIARVFYRDADGTENADVTTLPENSSQLQMVEQTGDEQ